MANVIQTGVCSYGMSGKLFHAPFIAAHPGFELAAIVERMQEDSRERYPRSRLCRSIEELLKDDKIELVVVNTPSYLHYEHSKATLLAGKNVLVEKPFTIAVKEAEELIELADKKNLMLTVFQNRRYDGDYRAVKEVVDCKWLGDMREVEIRYDRYRPHFSGKLHKEGDLPGAGLIYDLSPHLIDQALQLFGWPDAVFADIWKMREVVVAADYFEILLYYPRLRVRLKGTCIARESLYAYTLHGMKGSFLQQRSDQQEQLLQAGAIPSLESWVQPLDRPDGLLHTETDGQEIRKETTSTPGNYMEFFDDLCKALNGTSPNPVPGSQALLTTRVIENAVLSAREGRKISLS